MSENTSTSLINLGDISKPADTLIKKVSKAVGGFFLPYQITRVAKAESEAALIRAQTDIEITDLHRRALHRFIEEEAQRQKNIEEVTAKALPQLNEAANPDLMEDDWVTNFFDKSRIVSDEVMQDLWSRVLAGEANVPGTYSKRTVNFLSDLDKVDAELFSNLCGFGWAGFDLNSEFGIATGDIVPLVFDVHAGIYNKHGIAFDTLSHLESIGLIQFHFQGGFTLMELPKVLGLNYYDRPLLLELPNDADNQLQIGDVVLTKVGEELAPICGSKPVEGFWDYVKDKWKQHLPKPETEQETTPNAGSTETPPASVS